MSQQNQPYYPEGGEYGEYGDPDQTQGGYYGYGYGQEGPPPDMDSPPPADYHGPYDTQVDVGALQPQKWSEEPGGTSLPMEGLTSATLQFSTATSLTPVGGAVGFGGPSAPGDFTVAPDFLQSSYGSKPTIPAAADLPRFVGSGPAGSLASPAPLGFGPDLHSAMFSSPPPSAGPPFAGSQTRDLYSKAQSWVSAKGYGWLMEVDDEDDDDSKPLLEELDIDFSYILGKVRSVLLPYKLRPRDDQLTTPDFWGPFFVVLLYSFLLLWGQFRAVSWVFTLWLMGSFVVYFLSKVLGGGEGGLAEVLAVTGYSLIPLVLMCALLLFVHQRPVLTFLLKASHVLWCSYAAKTLLVTDSLYNKQCLIVYPIVLLYTYFVSLHSGV
eukprot:RCo034708